MQRYPDPKPAKFIHIMKVRTAGAFNAHTLCGRMVNFLSTGTEAEATCKRCVAESIAMSERGAERIAARQAFLAAPWKSVRKEG